MNLYYKILWFEDDCELVYDDILPEIEQYLDNLGFNIDLEYAENGDKLDELIGKKKYDLVLTDLNLGEGHEAGEKLIEHIRSNKLLTEVLLYSGNAEGINRIIKNHELIERVSFSIGIENLSDKLKQIINLTIKKVQEVNNVRGLVMAETSELDYKILLILQKYYMDIDADQKLKLENYMFDMVEESLRSNSNKLKRFKDNRDVTNFFEWPYFDSDKKRRTIQKLMEFIQEDLIDVHENCMDDYKEEILKTRNILAHVKEEISESGEIFLRSLVKGYESIIFNDELCISIRNNIRKHSKNLNKILEGVEICLQKKVKTG